MEMAVPPPFLGINTCQILPSVDLASPTIVLAGSIYSQLQKRVQYIEPELNTEDLWKVWEWDEKVRYISVYTF